MTPISSIALSGMQAAQTRLQSSAHNIANLQTDGFHRQEVTQEAQAEGGTTTRIGRAAAAGDALEADVVAQLEAKNSFLANLAVFRTGNKMLGTLFNEKA